MEENTHKDHKLKKNRVQWKMNFMNLKENNIVIIVLIALVSKLKGDPIYQKTTIYTYTNTLAWALSTQHRRRSCVAKWIYRNDVFNIKNLFRFRNWIQNEKPSINRFRNYPYKASMMMIIIIHIKCIHVIIPLSNWMLNTETLKH